MAGRLRKITPDAVQEIPVVDSVEEAETPSVIESTILDNSFLDEVEELQDVPPQYSEPKVVEEIIEEVKDPISKKEVPDGWEDMDTAPRNGMPIEIIDESLTNRASAFWKKTRAFANPSHKWEETGFWAGELSGQKLTFQAAFWKLRDRRR